MRSSARHSIRHRIFGGGDALSVTTVLIVNIPVVWGLNLAALYAAYLWGTGYGLLSPYAMLVNGVIPIIAAVRLRSYNPGLVTSPVVFLPLSLWTIFATWDVDAGFHYAALGLAVLVHVLIVAHILLRIKPAAG